MLYTLKEQHLWWWPKFISWYILLMPYTSPFNDTLLMINWYQSCSIPWRSNINGNDQNLLADTFCWYILLMLYTSLFYDTLLMTNWYQSCSISWRSNIYDNDKNLLADTFCWYILLIHFADTLCWCLRQVYSMIHFCWLTDISLALYLEGATSMVMTKIY